MSIDLSLDRIRKLLALLPVPYTRPTIHVAGTNGKGSVCAFVSSIIAAADPPLVVGRFNSPQLLTPFDAVCINNKPISSDVFWSARKDVLDINKEHTIGSTIFELFTCYALLIFERAQVDIVVLEVGVGGRLDATNAVSDDCILVSALTAVDVDHQALLGDTIETITREKAAIARRARPFVLGPQVHRQVEDVVRLVIGELGARMYPTCPVTPVEWVEELDGDGVLASGGLHGGIRVPLPRPVQIPMPCFSGLEPIRALLPLHGEHQLGNLGTAAGIISAVMTHPSCERFGLNLRERLTPAAISQGIQTTRWPGRLSYHTIFLPTDPSPDAEPPEAQLLVLADGAHNPASATALAAYLPSTLQKRTSGRPLVLTYILAVSHSPPKTPTQTLAPLFAVPQRLSGGQVRLGAALLTFTPPHNMPWVKPVPPAEIRAAIEALSRSSSLDVDIWQDSESESHLPQPVLTATTSEETELATPMTAHVERALRWAASRRGAEDGEDTLVVLAGSLYLVADFYRLLQKLGQAPEIWGAK